MFIHQTSLHQVQRTIIIKGINDYLIWLSDNRFTIITKNKITLKKYLKYVLNNEKVRANALRLSLEKNNVKNTLKCLKYHLSSKYSKLGAYCLDTFILKVILEHQTLFLLPPKFKEICVKQNRMDLRYFLITQPEYDASEYAFLVAIRFEENLKLKEAANFYAIALLIDGHERAGEALAKIAHSGLSEAKFLMAECFYHKYQNFEKAIEICLELIHSENHSEAMKYLENTLFPAEYYLLIARYYIEGEVITTDIEKAAYFLEKAYNLGDIEAAFTLGRIYSPLDELGNDNFNDLIKSSDYYEFAAQRGLFQSLEGMVGIANSNSYKFAKLHLRCGNCYLQHYSGYDEQALVHFKISAENGCSDAKNRIEALAEKNAGHAYLLGKIYENDASIINHFTKALCYYELALSKNNQDALVRLSELAADNYTEVQFLLSQHYHKHKAYKKAIELAFLASNSRHDKAKNYLLDTDFDKKYCLLIAKLYYEKFSSTHRAADINKAILFYKKAFTLKSKKAAKILAKIYDPNFENLGVVKNARCAFDYYLKAGVTESNFADILRLAEQSQDLKSLFLCVKLQIENFTQIDAGLELLKKLVNQNYQPAQTLIKQLITKDLSYVHKWAKLLEQDSFTQALPYYRQALLKNYEPTLTHLKTLSEKNNLDAQYLLAIDYFHRKKLFQQAIESCLRLAQKSYGSAIDYLNNTPFTSEHYIDIAKHYLEGKLVASDTTKAEPFLQKAFALGNEQAAWLLAEIYSPLSQLGFREKINKDFAKSYGYYEFAAQRKNKLALEWMAKIAQASERADLKLRLAQFYFANNNCAAALSQIKSLADNNYPPALKQLAQVTEQNSDYSYIIGNLYEKETQNDNLKKAEKYYQLALEKGHTGAYKALLQLSEQGLTEAQYTLLQYHHKLKDYYKAIEFALLASESYEPAKKYLFHVKFNDECYLLIADAYYQGQQVTQNFENALFFYQKAAKLKNQCALAKLAHAYDPNYEESMGINKNVSMAFYYYAQINITSNLFETLLRLARTSSEQTLLYQCAEIALINFKDTDNHLVLLKELMDEGYKPAEKKLLTLTDKDALSLYKLAKLYQSEDLTKAFHLYRRALLRNEPNTIAHLTKMAESGNTYAQYLLAKDYYYRQKNYDITLIICKQLLTKGFTEAYQYLLETTFPAQYYLQLAHEFESGEELLEQDTHAAIQLYQKALKQFPKEASYRLAELYEAQAQQSPQKIFDYYLMAAKKGNEKAFAALERLGEQVKPNRQKALSELYGNFFQNSKHARACYWRERSYARFLI